jgi:hypothetical protein
MAVSTSGFQLSALPQAPRINAADFTGAPEAFQRGLSNAVRIRAQQLELADAQAKSENEAVLRPGRQQIELATQQEQMQNIPLLGQAARATAQSTIDTAPAQTQASIAQARVSTITAQNREQFLKENSQLMNDVERAKLEHELVDAEYDGEAVTLQQDSGGLIKRIYRVSRKDPTKRRLIGEIMSKTPQQVESEEAQAGLEAEKTQAQIGLLGAQVKSADALAQQREAAAAALKSGKPVVKELKGPLGQTVGFVSIRINPETGELEASPVEQADTAQSAPALDTAGAVPTLSPEQVKSAPPGRFRGANGKLYNKTADGVIEPVVQ